MLLMLAQALNQQEMMNWVPVPTLKIKAEMIFFHVKLPSNSQKPVKALN